MEQELEHFKQKLKEKEKEMKFLVDLGIVTGNSNVIMRELEWFRELLDARISELDEKTRDKTYFSKLDLPDLSNENSAYAELVNKLELSSAERLMLVCSLVPHIAPEIFTNRLRKEGTNQLHVHYTELGRSEERRGGNE